MFNGTSLQPSKVVYVELTLQSVNEIRKQKRSKEKQVRALKDVHCYDWKTLVEKGELDTLKVPELDKYIKHNKLSKNGKEIDKIKRITLHYYCLLYTSDAADE